MATRRDFIRNASLLAGGTGIWSSLPASIRKAIEITPEAGSTFLDAEHIVFLMQENRSFDHCFGALQGVRGFNDPRAIRQPNGNLVWMQSNKENQTYLPFRLDIHNTKASWMQSLPHSWENQVDARNDGKFDGWLEAKRSGNPEYAEIPMTMGYYNREDIPFYYALADAFTVCDQHFCSSLTGTTPNRLYFWSGTLRKGADGEACVRNGQVDYQKNVSWKTFPERLEENGISWNVYQNEISLSSGLEGEEDALLANFTDNPLEWFEQYHVKYAGNYQAYLKSALPKAEEALQKLSSDATLSKEEKEKKQRQLSSFIEEAKKDLDLYTKENWEKLPAHHKAIHQKAFSNNKNEADYRNIEPITFTNSEGKAEEMFVPKGDILYQFRKDVDEGTLPTVSWIIAPEHFSDHPTSPWYGAWYVSEVLDILTKNPEVWKKTIFVLTYDENDGCYDHVPPFVAPDYRKPGTGSVSQSIDARDEFVTRDVEINKSGMKESEVRESAIGLGYRVPLVIASPWSRGGWVNSEVFDHTSSLQFLETFLQQKYGKNIREDNISTWRRAVCGDLTSVFRTEAAGDVKLPFITERKDFLESIYNAKNKSVPSDYKLLTAEQINAINLNPVTHHLMPLQETGTRPSNALHYELYADMMWNAAAQTFTLTMEPGNKAFGKDALGSAFHVYVPVAFEEDHNRQNYHTRSYAAAAGEKVEDEFPLAAFRDKYYHLDVYGPNGFYRSFKGKEAPLLTTKCSYQMQKGKPSGVLALNVQNTSGKPQVVEIVDNAYGKKSMSQTVNGTSIITLNTAAQKGWYDFSVRVKGDHVFERRYAGRIETGEASITDPFMGRVVG